MPGTLERLAGALGRRDEGPNQELAAELAASRDHKAIAELASAIGTAKASVANDAIKVLYEIGERRPELIAPHADAFFGALTSRNNRMVWGSLSALQTLATTNAALLASRLPEILDAADRSSVIAMDKTVSILATIAATPGLKSPAWQRLIAILRTSAINQTPMYAEAALRAAPRNDPGQLAAVIRQRLNDIHLPAKRARLEKVLRKLGPAAP